MMRNPPRPPLMPFALRSARHAMVAVVMLLSVVASRGAAQAAQPAKLSGRPDLAAVARRLIVAAKYATLVTLDDAKGPRTRMVQPQAPDSVFTVWFATNPRTRKVRDITRDGRVVLHYFDPVREGYVSLIGRARIVRDMPTKLAHWDKAWDAFYPSRDTSVVLVEVRASRLEIVSDKDGVTGDQATWRPPVFTVPKRK